MRKILATLMLICVLTTVGFAADGDATQTTNASAQTNASQSVTDALLIILLEMRPSWGV